MLLTLPPSRQSSNKTMVKYSAEPESAKSAKARGSNLRVHFKHTREVAHAIKGMKLSGVGLEGSAGRVEVTRVANTTPLNSFNS